LLTLTNGDMHAYTFYFHIITFNLSILISYAPVKVHSIRDYRTYTQIFITDLMHYLLLFAAATALVVLLVKTYAKLTTGWCRSQTCLVGKTAIVTGANTGIGFETALDFAKRGARVILACRDEQRANEARDRIVEETGNENVMVRLINMSSFDSVRAFAKEINAREDRLDILVNNAGAGGIGDKQSQDGHVLLMQINYFSSFLLTHLLIDLMKKTKKSRIVNVSSVAAKYARNFDVTNVDKFPGIYYVYYHSKLCNILFTIELAKRLNGTGITTYSLHPGAVKTEIFRHARGPAKLFLNTLKNLFFKTSEEGAQTTIYCAVAKGLEDHSGEHFADCRRVEPYKTATDPQLAKKLWQLTQEIVQLEAQECTI
jgi:retinol dehydrogenase-11